MSALHSVRGSIFAVSSPGGERTLVAEINQARQDDAPASKWPDPVIARQQMPWKSIQYFDLRVSGPGFEFSTAVPPDANGTTAEAQAAMTRLLRPALVATVVFEAQVDEASSIEVDVLPFILSRPFAAALEALSDSRALAEAIRSSNPGLAGDAEDLGAAHAFIEEASLARLACLYADGVHTPAFESGTLAEVGRVRWDQFRSRARAVLGIEAGSGSARVHAASAGDESHTSDHVADAPDDVEGDFSVLGGPAAEALARMVRAFGPGYPASLRADMNIVLDEISKLKRNLDHHVRTVPPEKPKRTRTRKRSAAT